MESWKSWSKEERDYNLSPSRFSKKYSDSKQVIMNFVETCNTRSNTARSSHTLEVFYASCGSPVEFFRSSVPDAPVFVFFHGGYWQETSHEMYSFVRNMFEGKHIHVAVVGFQNAPEVTIRELLDQCRSGMEKVLELALAWHCREIYLGGHSAGAQICLHILCLLLPLPFEIPSDIIKGVVLLDGVFDLRPLVGSYVNEALNLTISEAWDLSPLHRISKIVEQFPHLKYLVAIGDQNPPEYKRQSQEFFKELEGRKQNAKYLDLDHSDHFDVVLQLADANSSLSEAINDYFLAQ